MIEKLVQGDEVPFTQISNAMLCDPTITAKAKGVLCYMLSKPSSWQFNIKSIAGEMHENKDTVGRIVAELIEAHYVHRSELRQSGKFLGYEYTIYQSPHTDNSNMDDTPKREKPDMDSSDIPNKELETNKEGGSLDDAGSSLPHEPEPVPAPPPPVQKPTMKTSELFKTLDSIAETYCDYPPRRTPDENTRAETVAKKYGAKALIHAYQDYQKVKPGKPFRFFLEDTNFAKYKTTEPIRPERCETHHIQLLDGDDGKYCPDCKRENGHGYWPNDLWDRVLEKVASNHEAPETMKISVAS